MKDMLVKEGSVGEEVEDFVLVKEVLERMWTRKLDSWRRRGNRSRECVQLTG